MTEPRPEPDSELAGESEYGNDTGFADTGFAAAPTGSATGDAGGGPATGDAGPGAEPAAAAPDDADDAAADDSDPGRGAD